MPALQLSDARQEIERAEFFEHLAHETHLRTYALTCKFLQKGRD